MYYFGASSGDLTGVFVFEWICSILSGNENNNIFHLKRV